MRKYNKVVLCSCIHYIKCVYLAQFRCGILPLAVETGRYNDTPLEERLCEFCNSGCLEDEYHFLFSCYHYREHRSNLMSKVTDICDDFYFLSKEDKFKTLMNTDCIKFTAECLYKAYIKRKLSLYN